MNKELLRAVIYESWEYIPKIVLTERNVQLEKDGMKIEVIPVWKWLLKNN